MKLGSWGSFLSRFRIKWCPEVFSLLTISPLNDLHLHSTLAVYKHCKTGLSPLLQTVFSLRFPTQKFLPITSNPPSAPTEHALGPHCDPHLLSWTLPSFPSSVSSCWFHLLFCSSLNYTISHFHYFSCGLTSTFRFLTLLTLHYTNSLSWIHLGTPFLGSLSAKKGCRNLYNKDEISTHTLAKGLHCC